MSKQLKPLCAENTNARGLPILCVHFLDGSKVMESIGVELDGNVKKRTRNSEGKMETKPIFDFMTEAEDVKKQVLKECQTQGYPIPAAFRRVLGE